MTENKKKIIKDTIKKIQLILVTDMGIPIDSAKKINNLLNIIIQLIDKE